MEISPIQNSNVTRNEFIEHRAEFRSFRLSFNDFREEMHVFKDDMYAFKDAMYAFKSEMYSFRIQTEKRFDGVDKRLDILSRGQTESREDIPRYMTMLREGFRDDLKLALEIICEAVGVTKKTIDFPKL